MRSRRRRDGSLLGLVSLVGILYLGACTRVGTRPEDPSGLSHRVENLLEGGGFEQQSMLQRSPAGWFPTVVRRTKDHVEFAWDDQVVYEGQRSVSISIDEAHPDEVICYNWTRVVPKCEEGKTYELSGWIRTQNLSETAWIVAQCWDAATREMLGFATTMAGYTVTGTADWTQVGTIFTVPEGTHEVRIRAGIATPHNRGGKAWFDDLRVVHLPSDR